MVEFIEARPVDMVLIYKEYNGIMPYYNQFNEWNYQHCKKIFRDILGSPTLVQKINSRNNHIWKREYNDIDLIIFVNEGGVHWEYIADENKETEVQQIIRDILIRITQTYKKVIK
jgi:hypothetical protein